MSAAAKCRDEERCLAVQHDGAASTIDLGYRQMSGDCLAGGLSSAGLTTGATGRALLGTRHRVVYCVRGRQPAGKYWLRPLDAFELAIREVAWAATSGERHGEERLRNPYIKVSNGRPTGTEGTSEMKKYLLAGVLLVGFTGSAYAVTGQFDNMCAWGLANHKDVQTDCSVNATIKGNTYCFSSEDAKNQFMKNPDSNLENAQSFYKSEHKG
jgi:YHS domain-containing protein